MSLVRRVAEPAQKQEATGTGVANKEDEGMVGTEDRLRWFWLIDAHIFRYSHRGGGSFRSLLIDLSPGFMEYVRNRKEPGAIDAGEIGFRSEGVRHSHLR